MNTTSRCIAGLLGIDGAAAGGLALLGAGWYGLTRFILLPVFLGGLAAWLQPSARPAVAGRKTHHGFSPPVASLILVGLEGCYRARR